MDGKVLIIAEAGVNHNGDMDTALKMIDKMVDEDSELISIYYGRDTEEQDAGDFLKSVEEKYPACEVEMHYGGQPIYYYVISVE